MIVFNTSLKKNIQEDWKLFHCNHKLYLPKNKKKPLNFEEPCKILIINRLTHVFKKDQDFYFVICLFFHLVEGLDSKVNRSLLCAKNFYYSILKPMSGRLYADTININSLQLVIWQQSFYLYSSFFVYLINFLILIVSRSYQHRN